MDLNIQKYEKNNQLILKIRNDTDRLVTCFFVSDGFEEKRIDTKLFPNHQTKISLDLSYNDNLTIDYESEVIQEEKKVEDLTNGSIKKKMILFAIPIFLSSLFQTTYNLVDSLIVGKFLGKEALAAVSTSGNLIYLFTSFFLGASQGAGILIAKYFGAKKYHEMSKTIHVNIIMALISGIILTLLGVILTPSILRWMNTAEDVLPQAIDYFRFYFLGVIGIVLYNVFSSTLNSVGNSRRPLYYLTIACILNVMLDLFLIGYLELGVKYAAIATTISQFFSASLCLIYLLRIKAVYKVSVKRLEFSWKKIKEILLYGIPTGIQNSVIGLANVLVQSNVNTFGSDAMAGYGSYIKIENFVFTPINAFSLAISTFIGQNLGAKQYERAKKGAKFAIFTLLIMAEVFGIFFFILAPHLIALFNSDPEVVRYGVMHARVTSLFFFLLAFSHGIASLCRGSGRPIVAMLVMLLVWCLFRVIYVYTALEIRRELWVISMAYPITWFISSVIYLFYYLKSDWIHNFEHNK